jgi:hypothetical protein
MFIIHVNGENEHLSNVIEHYCENFFGEYYDKEVGLLNFGDYQPIKRRSRTNYRRNENN